MSFGEYSTTQFFIVFISVIFSGEAAASFFSYTTSLTKAQSAANYIFWLRRLASSTVVHEDPSKPPHPRDGDEPGATHIECQDIAFAYASRPKANVLDGINVDVSCVLYGRRYLLLTRY
jgi:ATP-binding cassette, subfamily B (MDR/TAP), member 1